MLKHSMIVVTAMCALVSMPAAAQAVGQADVLIQSLTVAPTPAGRTVAPPPTRATPTSLAPAPRGTIAPLPASATLDVQVVVFSYWDDDAQNVRVNIFLPPESTALSIPAGCTAAPTGGAFNAYVSCALGAMAVNATRTVALTISRPPSYVAPRVGVFAWSDTPDPSTANNHAEAVAP